MYLNAVLSGRYFKYEGVPFKVVLCCVRSTVAVWMTLSRRLVLYK